MYMMSIHRLIPQDVSKMSNRLEKDVQIKG